MSMDGEGTKWRRNIAENFNRLRRVHESYRQTTDGRAIAHSERELEFTFAKKIGASKPTRTSVLLGYRLYVQFVGARR